MASVRVTGSAVTGAPVTALAEYAELPLRETNHRCANDLQFVISLLSFQRRRAESPDTSTTLTTFTAPTTLRRG